MFLLTRTLLQHELSFLPKSFFEMWLTKTERTQSILSINEWICFRFRELFCLFAVLKKAPYLIRFNFWENTGRCPFFNFTFTKLSDSFADDWNQNISACGLFLEKLWQLVAFVPAQAKKRPLGLRKSWRTLDNWG